MTIAPISSPRVRFASSHHQEENRSNHATASNLEQQNTYIHIIPTETIELMSDPLNMERMILSNVHQIPEFSIPIQFTPASQHNAAHHAHSYPHAYFYSEDPEFNKVLDVINKRINRNPKLKQKLEKKVSPANFKMKLFSAPEKGVDAAYRNLLDTYGEGIYPILSSILDPNAKSSKKESNRSPQFKLDALMGQELKFEEAPRELNKILQHELGFGTSQRSQFHPLKKSHPEEQKIIQDWRVKQSARYVLNRATTINSSWAEWGASAGITTLWSFGTDVLAKNAGIISLFRKELKKTDFDQLPGWRKVILGIPDKIYNRLIKQAGANKKTGVVAIGDMGQGTAEGPDVLILQGAIQRSGPEGEKLTPWQGFMYAVKNKKWATTKAVVAASIGTSFEKAKELVWIPTTTASKAAQTTVGFVTNGVSVLSCGLPFFTEGGPQHREAASILAHTYNPATGTLKLPEADLAELRKKGTVKAVEEYFLRKASKELLHQSPTSKAVAASVPVAVGVSLIPSAINGVSTFLPEGLIPEIVKNTVSFLQVPAFGPVELLSMNAVAQLNKSYPQTVTTLSKMGRPVINAVYTPFSAGNRAISDAWSFMRGKKPENPHQAFQDFLEDLQHPA